MLEARLWAALAVACSAVVAVTRRGAIIPSEQASDHAVVFCTVPNKEQGSLLASSLLSEKLAACINILPGVESHYVWEGKVEVDRELLLMVKTRRSLVPLVTAHIREHHSYDEPEVIAVPITDGSKGYLDWVYANTANLAAVAAAQRKSKPKPR